jgi:hypothetical protein
MSNYSLDSNNTVNTFTKRMATLMQVKCCPPFPEAAWGELLRPFKRRPTVKRRSFSEDTAMTGVSKGEDR